MKTYSYSEARKNLDAILQEATGNGFVEIQHKNGALYRIVPVRNSTSSLSKIRGVKSQITKEEIIACVRERREV